MADGEEGRELSVKIPALRVEILTRDPQCQARMHVAQPRCLVAMVYALEGHCSIPVGGRTTDAKSKNCIF